MGAGRPNWLQKRSRRRFGNWLNQPRLPGKRRFTLQSAASERTWSRTAPGGRRDMVVRSVAVAPNDCAGGMLHTSQQPEVLIPFRLVTGATGAALHVPARIAN